MSDIPTEESFMRDVTSHAMTIALDAGVHRHVRFKKPGSGDMYFDIVTYPHFLVYSGDMGSFVFSRVNDMFQFFRGSPDGPLRINLRYWSEKLEAIDRPDGFKQYSADRFRDYVNRRLNNFRETMARDSDGESIELAYAELKDAVDDDVLSHADGEHPAYAALRDFNHGDRQWFTDYQEANFDEYTFRFVWCCYALAWGIRCYDAEKAKGVAA